MKHLHCPVNGWDCPYWGAVMINGAKHEGCCLLDTPMEDCDDFANMWDEGDVYIDDHE
jgi:hypothetical protein